MGVNQPRSWALRAWELAACVCLWFSACAKQPATQADAADRHEKLQTCIDSCTKVQAENPEESPYDCRAQCEELLDSIREE